MKKYMVFFALILFSLRCYGEYQLIEFPQLMPSTGSEVTAISENRWVCGFYRDSSSWVPSGMFIWHPEKGYKEINDCPHGARPVVINDKGQIAGNYYVPGSVMGTRGFFWDPETGFQDLGDFGGGITFVSDMNNQGHIVGSSQTHHYYVMNEYKRAFLWKDGQMINLGTLSGPEGLEGNYSWATSINDEGWIIGVANLGMPGMKVPKYSQWLHTIWNPEGEISEINIGTTNCEPSSKSLTNDGWFYAPGVALVHNIYTSISRKITYAISQLVTKDLGFSVSSPGYVFTYGKMGYQPVIDTPYPSSGIWTGKGCIRDMNSKGDIVGSAETKYGEQQAIILLK